MAEEVEMTPVAATEPPKADPLIKPVVSGSKTLKLATPQIKRPGAMTQSALRPGLKLPPKPGLATGLKLPPKPGLPSGVKLPAAPVIRKPGAQLTASLPKPVVAAGAVPSAPEPATTQNSLEALKGATQKLKGVTQPIPQQAILRKTGIIAEESMSEAQKEAAKHKTARISLSDAMGVAPVNNENAPMKTIRIKRPIDIPGAATRMAAEPPVAAAVAPAAEAPGAQVTENPTIKAAPSAMLTQRKTLKISRPGKSVQPAGKFMAKRPAVAAVSPDNNPVDGAAANGDIGEIQDIPNIPAFPSKAPVEEAPGFVCTVSTLVQVAACIVVGALAWFLYQNTQTQYF